MSSEKIYTVAELKEYDGTDPSKPILISIKGIVYDVSSGAKFYGKNGGYSNFAGREAQRNLAKMDINTLDTHIDDLDENELAVLDGWIEKFQKYPKVGKLQSN